MLGDVSKVFQFIAKRQILLSVNIKTIYFKIMSYDFIMKLFL